jgi:hypothetical protein
MTAATLGNGSHRQADRHQQHTPRVFGPSSDLAGDAGDQMTADSTTTMIASRC